MSEEAKLFLLKEKLDDVKRDKIYTMILLYSIVFSFLIYITNLYNLWANPILSFTIWGLIGGTIYAVLDTYFGNKKEEIIKQIEQMATENK